MVSLLPATGLPSVAAPRKSYSKIPDVVEVPNLIDIQLASFRWFMEDALKDLIEEISPIKDFNGNRMELEFIGYEFREPRLSEEDCRERDQSYSVPLYVKARLIIKATGEIKEPFELFFGDLPLMTRNGTFITSGTERVIVSQLLRSPGVYFTVQEDTATGRPLCHTSLIPSRGAWLEFETSNRDVISVKIDGRRKIPVTSFLRAVGYGSDQELIDLFCDVDTVSEHSYIKASIEKDQLIRDTNSALIDIYGRLRPGDPANVENAGRLVNDMFFSPEHYDLGMVGRYKVNRRLGLKDIVAEENRALTKQDIIAIIKQIIRINNGIDHKDDIDHLGNRRIRTVGELIQNQFRVGLLRLERVAKERMSIVALDQVTPSGLVNIRPVVAAVREFFGGSQLSSFMDQTNPLSELTNKRRLSAMGPGGLSRERAGFDVRDVHFSHYGRICPIETPEGPNIGLIGSLATYARVNRYGFIETPYRKVFKELHNHDSRLVGLAVRETITDESGETILSAGSVVDSKTFKVLAKLPERLIPVEPFVSDEIPYLSADEEDKYVIAQATARLDDRGRFLDERIESRFGEQYLYEPPMKVDYMDVSPKQIFSVAASLIPFLEHDDANRALMGANMQRQAVPLLRPEAPLVATGMEMEAVRYSGHVIFARNSGTVKSVTSEKIVVKTDGKGEDTYKLIKFMRTNQGTCINQRPVVSAGDVVTAGQVLADSSATENGELALGQNVICAFMSWHGYNYEDAIIISDRLVKADRFTSIHISKHEVEARDTKLGLEEITRDIPNVGEESLRELDEEGIIRVGAEVGPDDILVGKITPKGETELSAEEKLLRAIFGEKAREVKDTSLRMPHGEWGKVIAVKVFSRDNGDDLPARVNKWVQVWVAQKRKISVGDKLAGRHGNKGVISIVAPSEDMPFLPDGTPVDVVLNPIGVPSRMNLGQILELHLGWAGHLLGFKVRTPVFDGATDVAIEDDLARAYIAQSAGLIKLDYEAKDAKTVASKTIEWLNSKGWDGSRTFDDSHPGFGRETCLRLWLEEHGVSDARKIHANELDEVVFKLAKEQNISSPIAGKMILRDGKTGDFFDQPITVGNMYILKLIHLVEDKVHARATGPYSLISQQPLGGKAQFGGQRFGEMEVWTLEAYGAAYNLQEMLTIKSDDVTGRAKAYESIVKGEDVSQPGVPESFKVLVKELQSLGLAVEVINEEEKVLPAERLKETPLPEEESELSALASELTSQLLESNEDEEEDTNNQDE
ncbi:DNA-directed RNA polymerase subunit beta [Dehalogenimonas alkenigignens]|uniref:DNA-directed RNA polymerase subunit beta n=1 Tax=Dehalogenimonas alkenigignens TaxID=1217799 RepID=A0A0W0GJ23_9CHLR|nr:DNA-directed RNA polymerase subunit beta [Dehalogenimonas alkenigignens]KTB48567.1 DNA-directed RNA polymerase subunit beta [Dehalogenimonas alkenigignens]PVV84991.1 DNA-directed RNA polymerase subunit beta [Dehalogenimonas alkenigignens]